MKISRVTDPDGEIRRHRTEHISWINCGDRPDLVLLHGFSDMALCWSPLLSQSGWSAIALDARGHGESGLPEGPVSPDIQAQDVAGVLDDLGGEPKIIVGHSMGASTAIALAASRPELVQALVLEEPSPGGGAASRKRRMFDWLLRIRSLSAAEGAQWCRTEYPDWPVDEVEAWVRSKHALDAGLFDRPKPETPILSVRLAEIDCPMLLLHGDVSRGAIISPESAEACATAATERLTVAQIPGTGHNIHREARAAYLAAVESWFTYVLPS